MNIDVMCAQALVLSIMIMTACHMPHPQLLIEAKHNMMADKAKKQRLHIRERGKPILLCPPVHSRCQYMPDRRRMAR